MCLSITKPAGVLVPEEHLRQAYVNNKDGCGLAVINNGGICIHKGLFDIEEFIKMCAKTKDTPALIHFRFGTSGLKSKQNCHPFRLNSTWAMIHNGVLGIEHHKDESDTNAFCRWLRSMLPLCDNNPTHKEILEKQSNVLNGSKLTYMNNKGEFKYVNEYMGTRENGIWYSNTCFRTYVQRPTRSYSHGYSAGYGMGFGYGLADEDSIFDEIENRQRAITSSAPTVGLDKFEKWPPTPENYVGTWYWIPFSSGGMLVTLAQFYTFWSNRDKIPCERFKQAMADRAIEYQRRKNEEKEKVDRLKRGNPRATRIAGRTGLVLPSPAAFEGDDEKEAIDGVVRELQALDDAKKTINAASSIVDHIRCPGCGTWQDAKKFKFRVKDEYCEHCVKMFDQAQLDDFEESGCNVGGATAHHQSQQTQSVGARGSDAADAKQIVKV